MPPEVPSRRPRRVPRRPWLGPLALLVVVVVALLVGSGVLGGGRTTAAQRAQALETQIRCPSCVDISAADSSAATAASLRHQILQWVRAGRTDQDIENMLVARYGLSILLSPPASGLNAAVWVVPALAGSAALGALAVLFWRRSRTMHELTAATSR